VQREHDTQSGPGSYTRRDERDHLYGGVPVAGLEGRGVPRWPPPSRARRSGAAPAIESGQRKLAWQRAILNKFVTDAHGGDGGHAEAAEPDSATRRAGQCRLRR
jgi:hypothetical protein